MCDIPVAKASMPARPAGGDDRNPQAFDQLRPELQKGEP
jgi:hypothetical protein